jgi:hypothetical protein
LAEYRAGDTAAAVDAFLRTVCGEDYRATLERAVPDAFAIAVGEADQFFQAEMPAVRQFSFGPDEARRIRAPRHRLGKRTTRRSPHRSAPAPLRSEIR